MVTSRPVNLSSASILKGVGRTKSFCSKTLACDSIWRCARLKSSIQPLQTLPSCVLSRRSG